MRRAVGLLLLALGCTRPEPPPAPGSTDQPAPVANEDPTAFRLLKQLEQLDRDEAQRFRVERSELEDEASAERWLERLRGAVAKRAPAPAVMISVVSTPTGAAVLLSGAARGTTPLVTSTSAQRATIPLELRLEGFRTWKGALRKNETGHFTAEIRMEPE